MHSRSPAQPEDARTNAPVLHPWLHGQSACQATVRRRDVFEALQRRVVKALRLHELMMSNQQLMQLQLM